MIIGITVTIGGGFLISKRNASHLNSAGAFAPSKPWIEVITPHVFARGVQENRDDTSEQELKTGDEIEAGITISVDEGGYANIYFPDASMIRLDSGSSLTLKSAEFDRVHDRMSASIFLYGGRIWSKVFSLVTPESLWEVKTSNAVATVRGTAFDVSYHDGVSRIIGSENSVGVSLLDSRTGEIIGDTEAVVLENFFVEIRGGNMNASKKIIPMPAPQELVTNQWVEKNKKEDRELNAELESLHQSGLEGKALRNAFRQKLYRRFEGVILERRKIKEEKAQNDAQERGDSENALSPGTEAVRNLKKEIMPLGSSVNSSAPSMKDTTSNIPQKNLPLKTTGGDAVIAPKGLLLRTSRLLERVIEGDEITFTAILTMNDGSERNITTEVQWQVIGAVGMISNSGVFIARLAASHVEFGFGTGSLVAVWKDPATSKEWVAASPIFKVEAKVEQILEQSG